jgi:hypothetical protein
LTKPFGIPYASFGLATLVAACQSTPDRFDYRAQCGWDDDRNWELVQVLPETIEKYRALADENPNLKTDPREFSVESWFSLPSGELMLCRTDGSPNDSCVGEWWQFENTENEPSIIAQSAWICVT